MTYCNAEGCLNHAANGSLRCLHHISKEFAVNVSGLKEASSTLVGEVVNATQKQTLASQYPKYYKAVPEGWKFLDTYAVNILFPVDDPSGCILHARKKLLVPGVRSGGKSMRKDITEARDTLNRWLELNPE